MKYVLVENYNIGMHFPFSSDLDIDTLTDQLSTLNEIAITEHNDKFNFNHITLFTIVSRFYETVVEDYYNIYTLEDWFEKYKV